MTLPHAELAGTSTGRRFARWVHQRLAPPRSLQTSSGFSAASYWSLTGALGAGFAVSIYVLFASGTIWEANVPFTIGSAIVAVFGALFWFWPFLLSYYTFLPLHRFQLVTSRRGAAIYGAVWHCTAHYLFLDHLGAQPITSAFICPLLVGALWGSWLPAADAEPAPNSQPAWRRF